MKIWKLLFLESFSVSISFTISIENHPCNPKKKGINLSFIAVIYFLLTIQLNVLTLINTEIDSRYMVNDLTPLWMYQCLKNILNA